MDKIKTENYYKALNNENLCSCDYCRNYYKEAKETYPELSDYLARMGIDIEKPLETMPLEPYEGAIEYIAVQYIALGNVSVFILSIIISPQILSCIEQLMIASE